MDSRDLGGAITGAVPALASIALGKLVGPPMDALIASPWAPLLLLLLGLLLAAVYYRFQGVSRSDYQTALDKVIDHVYVLPPASRPPKGISTEGIVQEHAPHNFRRDWYLKLGLPEPTPHRSQYR